MSSLNLFLIKMPKNNFKNIPFNSLKDPIFSSQLKSITSKVIDSGWYILGSELKQFENNFAEYLGVKYCIGVGNGLEALQMSLMSLGIGKGDEVITTPISAFATTLAILAVGAEPVFVDTDENGLINVDLVEKAITKKTKAVLPVHLYGNAVELDKIKAICKKYKLFLIEDACQAHGSKFRNKFLGTFGELGAFSFYPTKNLGALGDGGAIVTNNKDLSDTCRQIRDYGQSQKYLHIRYGLNSRLDELQAAILNLKLKYLDNQNNKIREIVQRYVEKLSSIKNVKIISSKVTDQPSYHLLVIRTNKRDLLRKYLEKFGIQTAIHYPLTIPDQPIFEGKYKTLNIPVSRKITREALSLPIFPTLKIEEVDYICDKIYKFFK